jgi:Erythromycin esterase homolog
MPGEYGMSQSDRATWIREHALAISADLEMDYADLSSLQASVGSARIVALGESTYGAHDVFLLKQRLVQFLIEEMGFTLFALSAPWAGTCALNEFVYAGRGSVEDLEGMMVNLGGWQWMTEEMLALLYWLREYNMERSEDQRVSFLGLDCLPYIQAAIDNVLLCACTIDEAWALHLKELYRRFSYYDSDLLSYSQLSQQEHALCRQQLQQVADEFVQRRSRLIAAVQRDRYLEALQNVRVLLQAEELAATQDFARRDYYMAGNARWLLTHYQPEAKMVIWSHNAHIALQLPAARALPLTARQTQHLSLSSATADVRKSNEKGSVARGIERNPVRGANGATMGAYLLQYYPDELLTIGCSFGQGSFYALDAQQPDVLHRYTVDRENVPEDSFEALFGVTELTNLFVDLRGIDMRDEQARWLSTAHLSRCVGKSYQEQQCWQPLQLLRSFDLYAFVQTSAEAQLLPAVDEWVVQLPVQPYNLDFAYELEDWHLRSTYRHQIDIELASEQSTATRLSIQSAETVPARYFCAFQEFQARDYLQQRIRLSAYIETREVSEEVGLWLRICRGNAATPIVLGNSYCSVTQQRTLHTVVLDVPADSVKIELSVALCGTGALWLDTVQLEIVGTDVPLTLSDV